MDAVEQLLGLQTGWVGRGFNLKEGAAGFLQAKPGESSGRSQEEEMSWKWELQPLGQPFLHGMSPQKIPVTSQDPKNHQEGRAGNAEPVETSESFPGSAGAPRKLERDFSSGTARTGKGGMGLH